MCGIAGVAGARACAEHDELLTMRETMAHRGPDDSGVWVSQDRSVGLAHRRLSIIDLSAAGSQPMSDATGQIQIAFNGEIYNFRELREELAARGHSFRSSSDTEVILEAYREWGIDCIRRLEGMFSLALYDGFTRQLHLSRDRAGEKPLFVWHVPGRLCFASELKALFVLNDFPRQIDADALECYLAYGYVPRDLCIVKGVRKLLPGHTLTFDVASDRVDIVRYWELPVNNPLLSDPEALSQELETRLASAVRRQLVADVPVAIMLSGGVDSSLITALAARSVPRVKTFTVSFPGAGVYDEASYAQIVARHFGTDHVAVRAEPATLDLLPRLARQFDEPIADSSMVPTYIVSRMIGQHARVALGGDGGDELFGGYLHYAWLKKYQRMQALVPQFILKGVSKVGNLLPVGARGRNYILGLGGSDRRSILGRVNTFFDPAMRRCLVEGRTMGSFSPEQLRMKLGSDGSSLVDSAQRMDFRSYMVDDILVKVDRASMLASVEVRAPFLDVDVVEFAFREVPDSLRTDGKERKILLRRLASRLLPSELNLDRKQGFSIPLHEWIAGPWGDFMKSVLLDSAADLFDHGTVRQLFAAQLRGRRNEQRLFALTIFELWRREYGLQV